MCLGVSLETGDWREGGEAAAAAAKKNILLVISCLVAVVFLPVEKGGGGAHACMRMYDGCIFLCILVFFPVYCEYY